MKQRAMIRRAAKGTLRRARCAWRLPPSRSVRLRDARHRWNRKAASTDASADAAAPASTSSEVVQADFVTIQESLDKYTWYVKNYVGRNLAACGYVSLAGRLTDQYGNGYVAFALTADDGSYVDPGDEESLSRYRVVA